MSLNGVLSNKDLRLISPLAGFPPDRQTDILASFRVDSSMRSPLAGFIPASHKVDTHDLDWINGYMRVRNAGSFHLNRLFK